jgi:ornithine decarboxylase
VRRRTLRPGDPRRSHLDSADILYRRDSYELPLELAIGDPVDFLAAGAYTTSVAAVAFNGFPPIRSYLI